MPRVIFTVKFKCMKVFNNSKSIASSLLKAILFVGLVFNSAGVSANKFLNCPKSDEDAICGVWYTNNNNSKVEIYNDNGNYFGRIIWLKDPNKSMYTNQLVILNMAYNQNRQMWDSGTLYYPVNDAQYKGFIELRNRDTLLIRAYVGTPFMGKTITWVRAK